MPNVQLHIKYSKNISTVITARDLLDLYFYGIDTRAKDGSSIPLSIYDSYIRAAQDEVEKFFGIKILRQVVREDQNYYGSDWTSWGIMQTSYHVNEPISLVGFYGHQKHVEIPKEWLVAKKSSHDLYHRALWLVPNGAGNITTQAILGGTAPFVLLGDGSNVPAYWDIKYITGYNKIPSDLVNLIGKLAAINIFNILGDLILGNGISSQSLGIDGLTQSISTTASAGKSGYNARVTMYLADIKEAIPRLKEFYRGISFTCV